MTEMINQFHFLRPAWLLALIALLPIIFLLWRKQTQAGQWQDLISPELLPYLLEGKTLRVSPLKLMLVAIGWIITCIALAGPSWKKLPVAVEKNQSAMVILLDLSPSMLTEDIKPSRIVRARLKIADLLRDRPDGQTALLVYAANAHVVTPLTDDAKTITNLLPQLTPGLMPAPGSNTEEAVSRGIALLKDAGLNSGDLLIITDGIADEAQATIKQLLKGHPNIRLSILGVGGLDPAPIPSRNGGFVRDKKNNIVTSQLDVPPLRDLAVKNGGRYKTLSNDPNEMQIFTRLSDPQQNPSETKKTTGEFDQWADAGYWLIFLLLPLLALAFRRGTLLALLLLPVLLATPDTTYALSWNDLWKNSDQRALEKLQNDNASDAAKEFTREDWQAAAEYRAGNYEEAAKHYAKDTSATGHYNRGNALAKSGNLPEAIKAYDQALKQQPDMEDAKKNRQLVEEELKKQEQQKQQGQNKDDQQNQEEQDQQQQDGEQKDSSQSQQNSSESEQQSSSDDQQQSSSADNSQNQDRQNQESQSSSSGQQTSAGQSASASSASDESMQESLQKNQEADSNLSSQAAIETAASSSAASADARPTQPIVEDGLTDEERKQLEQWLRRVPDDPSGLLRRKFEYEYYKLRQQKMNGTWEAPSNEADQRL